MTAAWGAIMRWPITPAGRAIQKQAKADGLCYVEPTPFLATLDELRTIRIGRNEVVFHFNNSGDDAVRTVRLNATHPANVKPSRFGDATGKWEGETLVIDTIAFEPIRHFHQHTVERAQAHRGAAHTHRGSPATALRDHGGGPRIPREAGQLHEAVGPPA
jgi:methionine aminopeptidase